MFTEPAFRKSQSVAGDTDGGPIKSVSELSDCTSYDSCVLSFTTHKTNETFSDDDGPGS